ncbi:ATP-binding protein [Aerophototrophica crusticola]|uniref:ATP-binding protein n=1 Tax=Aerophototrophica crusticola TaxID=1709002 RepID=A0A858R6A8_9PROT|nr:ATP-binding protein [Rhodospirillaceae bacterium B3]
MAQKLGLGIDGAETDSPPDLLLVGDTSADELRAALVRGIGVVVDADDPARADGVLPVLGRPNLIHLSLSTLRAFRLELAPLLCEALQCRGWIAGDRRPEVELCVHEAVSNAIVHGNLGIQHGPSEDPASFDRFYAEVRMRLADPVRAGRILRLDAVWDGAAVEVQVDDEGAGFQSGPQALPSSPAAKSGRGLHIMRELSDGVSFDRGGRTVRLRFRR